MGTNMPVKPRPSRRRKTEPERLTVESFCVLIRETEERQHIVLPGYVNGAPDLIVEIIAPSTAPIDRLKKKQYFEF
jgi:Uma2 family endonuclease